MIAGEGKHAEVCLCPLLQCLDHNSEELPSAYYKEVVHVDAEDDSFLFVFSFILIFVRQC